MELSNTEIKIVVKNMAREMVKRATAKNGPRILAGEHKGHKFYFENSSYNAPSLKLYGFRSDNEIIRAIDKALLKKENATAKNASSLKEGDKVRKKK
jgi:hypothetical protein